ncbi:MAG: Asp-tRNA(Asn)/Glu-tRNA(Gln) amidotransferase subunit GatA [Candidatus Gracilibacteria bacterium]|jgi:aspartyl-tRNA(Asn)/glutamyl-tRNA(Gln) amidotransferase subunit A|nr:Asp-tRNA(Asn)/Glu-tRNA(Gln) amidotransferase subunit GatA [Candidatus Gracilibacteria bacterium]
MQNLTIKTAKELLKSGQKKATDLVNEYFSKIEQIDPELGAYLSLNKEGALKKADEQDKKGTYDLPLEGIPVSIKDVIAIKGLKNTAGSKILENYISPYDSVVWERLEKAGAIVLGKVNTDEFTMGSSTENSALKSTRNPWNKNHVPGGSSGGSACSVASNQCVFSIGTDTGGSIRQPANFCGCVGLKPTYGRVPRYGVISYASSFDTIGPLTKNVEDAAIVMEIISGISEKDATTVDKPIDNYSENLQNPIKGKKIGIIKEFIEQEGFDPELKKDFMDNVEKFAKTNDLEIKEISMSLTEYAIATYYILVKSEASTNLARYDGVRYGKKTEEAYDLEEFYKKTREKGLGSEVKRAIMTGTFALSSGYFDAYYKKASKVRTMIKKEFDQAFNEVDAIFAPVSPFQAFKIGEKINDPLQMYLSDIFTVTTNLAGIPSIAIPTGVINELPTGLQIMGQHFAEKDILNFAWHLEQMANFKGLE